MRGAQAADCPSASLNACGRSYSPSRSPRCPCLSRHHGTAVLDHPPLVLSRVHWVRPELVVEVSYVEWTPDGLLRHVVYLGEREDKPASDVIRERPG